MHWASSPELSFIIANDILTTICIQTPIILFRNQAFGNTSIWNTIVKLKKNKCKKSCHLASVHSSWRKLMILFSTVRFNLARTLEATWCREVAVRMTPSWLHITLAKGRWACIQAEVSNCQLLGCITVLLNDLNLMPFQFHRLHHSNARTRLSLFKLHAWSLKAFEFATLMVKSIMRISEKATCHQKR